jgi:ParB-like chromosome segregation protein Spo0J
MELRNHPAVTQKNNVLRVDVRELHVEDGFNLRDMTTEANQRFLDELTENIREFGVLEALEVRVVGDKIFVVNGHTRRLAALRISEEDNVTFTVPITPEPTLPGGKALSPDERLARQMSHNKHNPNTPLEIAEGIRKLKNYGWDEEKIQRRFGKSLSWVNDHLLLDGAPQQIKNAVNNEKLAYTTAADIMRRDDPEAVFQEAEKRTKLLGRSKIIRTVLPPPRQERPTKPQLVIDMEYVLEKLLVICGGGISPYAMAQHKFEERSDDVYEMIAYLTKFAESLRSGEQFDNNSDDDKFEIRLH